MSAAAGYAGGGLANAATDWPPTSIKIVRLTLTKLYFSAFLGQSNFINHIKTAKICKNSGTAKVWGSS